MKDSEYIRLRVDHQIDWLGAKSKRNKICYQLFNLSALLFSASIPLISLLIEESDTVKIITSVLGITIALTTGAQSIFKFHEKWIHYRNTSESLKREKLLFITGSAPYNQEVPFSDFVNNVEGILHQENLRWSEVMINKKK